MRYPQFNLDFREVLLFGAIIKSAVSFLIVLRRLLFYLHKVRNNKGTNNGFQFDECFCVSLLTFPILVILIYFGIQEPEILPYELNFIELISAQIFFCVIVLIYEQRKGYGGFDLIKVHSDKLNIGATWAYGAYRAYFEVSFKDWSYKVRDYIASGKQLSSNALILVCPLSCNVQGKLSDKSENISEDGFLDKTEYDQGANTNRYYKFPVYKINDDNQTIYICAQYPCSFGTLWETKDRMEKNICLYHRCCFMETLRKLLQPFPCVILEYDDVTSKETLDLFLLRKLGKKKKK